jgi:hypothetical protein
VQVRLQALQSQVLNQIVAHDGFWIVTSD